MKVIKTERVTSIPTQCPWPSDQPLCRHYRDMLMNMSSDWGITLTQRRTTPHQP